MKQSSTLILLLIALFGCKKNKTDDKPKETYHVSITSSHEDSKFLFLGNEKRSGYIKKAFETDFQAIKGKQIEVWTGFEFNNPKSDHSITVVVTKGANVFKSITQKEHVSLVASP